jgi:hypothetical protein
LVTTINDGRGKIEPIHSMFYNFVGINFLGKLHNTKQHIQFVRWLKDEIEIPENTLCSFLTSYSNCPNTIGRAWGQFEDKQLLPSKKEKIAHSFNQCDFYIFEICSLKLYEKNGYQVQHELTDDYDCVLQSETDLYNDLEILQGLIPKGKKILFQIHFRPNVIYNDASKIIDKREIIYNVVNNFCNTHENAYLYDPSVLLNTDKSLYTGDIHFNTRGYEISFNYIYDNFLQKFSVLHV